MLEAYFRNSIIFVDCAENYYSIQFNSITLIVLEKETGIFPMLTVAKNTAATLPKLRGNMPVINNPEIINLVSS